MSQQMSNATSRDLQSPTSINMATYMLSGAETRFQTEAADHMWSLAAD